MRKSLENNKLPDFNVAGTLRVPCFVDGTRSVPTTISVTNSFTRPKHKTGLLGVVAIAMAIGGGANARNVAAKEAPEAPFSRRLAVSPFPAGLQWINAAGPIELRSLHGKFVLLDFWTLGCINCMHLIPELRKLEHAWPKELVVIGVHSAKFASEKESRNIEEAVHRYRIEHPVVNDSDFVIWKSFGVQAWPSLVLIDPEGYAVWAHSGEATFEQLDALLRKAAPVYRRNGSLNDRPIAIRPCAGEGRRHAATVPRQDSGGRGGWPAVHCR